MSEEDQLGPSYDGTVVLDIGGEVGALIILTAPELHLAEIELARVDGAAAAPHMSTHTHADGTSHRHANGRTHVAVRERRGPSGTRYAAIYPSLRQGEYTVFDLQGEPTDTVRVIGGEVAQLDWR